MSDVGVDHGYGDYSRGIVRGTAYSGGIGVGVFTATAAGTTTISDSAIAANALVMVTPTNGAGGLLIQSKSCYVGSVSAGAFTFVVSATGAGAPAGTETFSYMFLTES